MKLKKSIVSFFVIGLVYISILWFLDSKKGTFSHLNEFVSFLPQLIALAILSWIVRYIRWVWLLRNAGYHFPVLAGFGAYVAGFAFTATPGKVGELVRIRYFLPFGVPPEVVISAFVFERMSDLLVILCFALLVASHFDFFWMVLFVVFTIIFILIYLIFRPLLLRKVSVVLKLSGWNRSARFTRYLLVGLLFVKHWINIKSIFLSFIFGAVAWGIMAMSFVWLLMLSNVDLGWALSVGTYPLAMLSGAMSMVPGGMGTTEASIIAILWSNGVGLAISSVIAITIRLASLWSAIFAGLLAIFILESRGKGA